MFPKWCFLTLSAIGLAAAVEKYDLQSLDATYDYIIVGGGVSGLVVANRLSENPGSKSTSIRHLFNQQAFTEFL